MVTYLREVKPWWRALDTHPKTIWPKPRQPELKMFPSPKNVVWKLWIWLKATGYTLRSIPIFDVDGLWFYDDIGFFRAGSMTDTLVELACNSPEGITAEELGKKLSCRCHSILVRLTRDGKLQRCKMGRANIYIANDADIATIQREAATSSDVQLPAEIAVLILVEFINNPGLSFVQLAKAISQSKKVTVSAAQIETLFTRSGVKKTPLM